MLVKVFRAQPWYKVEVDIDEIYSDSVKWVKGISLSGDYYGLPYYVLKCQIPYSTAVKLNIASGLHASKYGENRANIYLYKKDNEKDPNYKEGYKYLCDLAGPKPKI